MNYEQIQELIKTMVNSNLTSLELELDGVSLKLKKGVEEGKMDEPVLKAEKAQKPSTVYAEPVKAEASVEVKTEGPDTTQDDSNIKVISSPMVGTFYASAGPGKDDFVSIGSKIKKGQVLCIIEAMKLMNEIEAEIDGEVVEILADNEQMVEYGQPLFKVRMEK